MFAFLNIIPTIWACFVMNLPVNEAVHMEVVQAIGPHSCLVAQTNTALVVTIMFERDFSPFILYRSPFVDYRIIFVGAKTISRRRRLFLFDNVWLQPPQPPITA